MKEKDVAEAVVRKDNYVIFSNSMNKLKEFQSGRKNSPHLPVVTTHPYQTSSKKK